MNAESTFACTCGVCKASQKGIPQKQKETYKGLTSRPTRTVVPKEGENYVFFQNVGNQLKLKTHILFMQYLGQLLRKSKAPRETQENVTPRKQAK